MSHCGKAEGWFEPPGVAHREEHCLPLLSPDPVQFIPLLS